jgi:hypothetical protein
VLRRFIADEQGSTAIEYELIAAGISLPSIIRCAGASEPKRVWENAAVSQPSSSSCGLHRDVLRRGSLANQDVCGETQAP